MLSKFHRKKKLGCKIIFGNFSWQIDARFHFTVFGAETVAKSSKLSKPILANQTKKTKRAKRQQKFIIVSLEALKTTAQHSDTYKKSALIA